MKKGEVIELLREFYQKVLSKKPPIEKMKEEAKLMGVKLKPVQGDLTKLAFERSDKLIEIVWLIGKLDEFLHLRKSRLSQSEVEELLSLVNEVYGKELNESFDLEKLESLDIELEIVKEVSLKKRLN